MTDADSTRLQGLIPVKDLGTKFIDDELLFLSVRKEGDGYVGCGWGMHTRLYVSDRYPTAEEAEADLNERFRRG